VHADVYDDDAGDPRALAGLAPKFFRKAPPAGTRSGGLSAFCTLVLQGGSESPEKEVEMPEQQSEEGRLRVAVAGATGAVGQVLLRILEERRFPVARLLPLASERSAGGSLRFAGALHEVEVARPEAFDDIDLVFFAATGELSRTLAPEAVRRGALVIDKSSTWRMDPDVPLAVPEINPEALRTHKGIFACPNCTTIGLVMALEPLRRAAGLRRVVVTTLQAVSGAGLPGVEELDQQLQSPERGARVFAAPIAHNVVPLCDAVGEHGYTGEEWKLLHESRKILGLPELEVAMTCVRVPVRVGHSATVLVETERPLSAEQARIALESFPGVRVCGDEDVATSRGVEGHDEVRVSRIRKDLTSDRLWLWQSSDNLRKGAATNAVQIAEVLLEEGAFTRSRTRA